MAKTVFERQQQCNDTDKGNIVKQRIPPRLTELTD